MDHFFENIERKIAGILELKTRILNAMEPAVITIFSLLEKKKKSLAGMQKQSKRGHECG